MGNNLKLSKFYANESETQTSKFEEEKRKSKERELEKGEKTVNTDAPESPAEKEPKKTAAAEKTVPPAEDDSFVLDRTYDPTVQIKEADIDIDAFTKPEDEYMDDSMTRDLGKNRSKPGEKSNMHLTTMRFTKENWFIIRKISAKYALSNTQVVNKIIEEVGKKLLEKENN